ncbi:beta-glucanase, partial [Bacillus pumilus]|nr:beta-glucanase [Bacillus pumilus]
MSYRVKRMLMLLVTGIVLSLSTFTAGASAQTGGSFYEPFNNYNT